MHNNLHLIELKIHLKKKSLFNEFGAQTNINYIDKADLVLG